MHTRTQRELVSQDGVQTAEATLSAHCPNRLCFHFQAWGRHLEFSPDATDCPECGHPLKPGSGPTPERTLQIGPKLRQLGPVALGLGLLLLERLPIPILSAAGTMHIAHVSQRLRPFVLSVLVLYGLERLRGVAAPIRTLRDAPVSVVNVALAAAFALALVAIDMDAIAAGGVAIETSRRVVWTGALVVWSGAYIAAHHLIRRYTAQSGIIVLCTLDILVTSVHWLLRP